MNFTLNFDFTYAIEPSGVIALATLIGVGVIMYGVYRIQSYRNQKS